MESFHGFTFTGTLNKRYIFKWFDGAHGPLPKAEFTSHYIH